MTTPIYPFVGLVGTGAMGRGIAQIAAQGGCQVLLFDAQSGAADTARAAVQEQWQRLQAKGEAVLLAERDSDEQAAVRQRMPVASHRRFFPPVEPRPARTE